MHVQYLHVHIRGVFATEAQSVECSLQETWGHEFDPGRDLAKSLKMVLMLLA